MCVEGAALRPRPPRPAGATMMKHCRKSKPKSRLIRVTATGDGITWVSRKKNNLGGCGAFPPPWPAVGS